MVDEVRSYRVSELKCLWTRVPGFKDLIVACEEWICQGREKCVDPRCSSSAQRLSHRLQNGSARRRDERHARCAD